jgi:hypothetical protein
VSPTPGFLLEAELAPVAPKPLNTVLDMGKKICKNSNLFLLYKFKIYLHMGNISLTKKFAIFMIAFNDFLLACIFKHTYKITNYLYRHITMEMMVFV